MQTPFIPNVIEKDYAFDALPVGVEQTDARTLYALKQSRSEREKAFTGFISGRPSLAEAQFKIFDAESMTNPDEWSRDELISEVLRLKWVVAQVATSRQHTKLDRAEQIATRQVALDKANEEFTEFKQAVGERAMELAAEHGWCDVVSTALNDLGIPIPSRTRRVRLTVEIDVEVEDAHRRLDAQSEQWLRDSVSDHEHVIRMDGDFDHQDAEVLMAEITSVEILD